MVNSNYVHAFYDGLNDYYVDEIHRDLVGCFGLPPCVFDGFLQSRPSEVSRLIDSLEGQNNSIKDDLSVLAAKLSRSEDDCSCLRESLLELEQRFAESERKLVDREHRLDISLKSLIAAQDELQSCHRLIEEMSNLAERSASKIEWLREQKSISMRILSRQFDLLRRTLGLLDRMQ